MNTGERLVRLLRDRFGCEIGDVWEFRRTYAGRCQREAGAWSWCISYHDGRRWLEIGGYVPAYELLRTPIHLVLADETHDPNSRTLDFA